MGVQVGYVLLEPGSCTGCLICELVCSFSKFRVFNPRYSMIRITYNHELGRVEAVSVCIQCGVCITACPVGALRIEGNVVTVDYGSCTGCLACVSTCPNRAFRVVNGRPYKCDFCGGSPQCIRYCVRGALRRA